MKQKPLIAIALALITPMKSIWNKALKATNDFTNNVKYISKESYDFFKKSKLFGGELIICKIGSAGLNYVMPNLNRPVSLGLNQIMVRLRPPTSRSRRRKPKR